MNMKTEVSRGRQNKQYAQYSVSLMFEIHIIISTENTHVCFKSPYPVRNTEEGLWTGVSLEHMSIYGRMPFLTPPMALMGFEPTAH